MRYVFFGTPEFAAIILEKLIEANLPPIALVANPDRPYGRKQIVTPPPTKQLVMNLRLPIEILQPDTINDVFMNRIRTLSPMFFIVVAYAKILSKELLAIPQRGALGVHPSLLPKYRGTTPIQSAILGGDEKTGVTIYRMDEQVDHGPILGQTEVVIGDASYGELAKNLAYEGGLILTRILPVFIKGTITTKEQNHSQATFTKKFKPENGFIDQETLEKAKNGDSGAALIWRKIRALNPEPGTYTIDEHGKRIKLLEAALVKGKMVLKKIQAAGKRVIEINGN